MICKVIVFAKAPVPGLAKTRLIAALGADGAAALAERLLAHALAEAWAAALGPVELCGAPTVRHAGFTAVLERLGLSQPGPRAPACGPALPAGSLRGDSRPSGPDNRGPASLDSSDQGEGDLGERMQRALERALQEPARSPELPAPRRDGSKPAAATQDVLLIGTDIPGLDRQVLRAAAAALAHSDAVFVPTDDGGYALIGLRPPAPTRLGELFADMPWSGPEVMALTRERLARIGLRHAELPALRDIDGPADLPYLPAQWLPPGHRP